MRTNIVRVPGPLLRAPCASSHSMLPQGNKWSTSSPHFTDEEVEAQRGNMYHILKRHTEEAVRPGLNHCLSGGPGREGSLGGAVDTSGRVGTGRGWTHWPAEGAP